MTVGKQGLWAYYQRTGLCRDPQPWGGIWMADFAVGPRPVKLRCGGATEDGPVSVPSGYACGLKGWWEAQG
jgi:hypothetical protein